MQSHLAALAARFPFVQRLSAAGARVVREAASAQRIPAGTQLLNEGTACDTTLLVTQGAIAVFKTTPAGRRIGLYRVEAGESCVLGIACVLGGRGYPARAMTAAELDAVALPAAVFRKLFAAEPAVQEFVMDLFSQRLATVMALVEEIAFQRVDVRLARFLVAEAGRQPEGLVTLGHEEIAASLGTAREVVSRLLAHFEQEGLLRTGRRRIEVTDRAGLELRGGEDLPPRR